MMLDDDYILHLQALRLMYWLLQSAALQKGEFQHTRS